MSIFKASKEIQGRDSGISYFCFSPREIGLARLEVHTRLGSTDYVVLMWTDFLVSGLLHGILVSPFKKDNFFPPENIFFLEVFQVVLPSKSGPEGQQEKLETSAADIQAEQPLEPLKTILLLRVSGVSFALFLYFCLGWSWLHQLPVHRGVRSHLCTHVPCTVGVSSLILSIVWSALTQHITYSLWKTHQSGC